MRKFLKRGGNFVSAYGEREWGIIRVNFEYKGRYYSYKETANSEEMKEENIP